MAARNYIWVFTHTDTYYETNEDPTVLLFATKGDALHTMYQNVASHFGLSADASYKDIKRYLREEELIVPQSAISTDYWWEYLSTCTPEYIRVYEHEGFSAMWHVERLPINRVQIKEIFGGEG